MKTLRIAMLGSGAILGTKTKRLQRDTYWKEIFVNLKGVEGDSHHVFVQGDICDKEFVTSLFEKYDFDCDQLCYRISC